MNDHYGYSYSSFTNAIAKCVFAASLPLSCFLNLQHLLTNVLSGSTLPLFEGCSAIRKQPRLV